MSNVTTKFTGDAKDLLLAQEQVARGTEEISQEYKKAAREAAELERAAKRLLASIETPQEQHNERLRTLNKLLESGRINQDQFERATRKSHETLNAQSAQVSVGLKSVIGSIGGVVAGYVGVQQAVSGVITLIDEWDERQKRLAEKANETARGVVPFLSIQPEGTGQQRLQQVAQVARGSLSITEAADTAQAIQSVTGSFDDAIAGLKAVVAGERLLIPPELGTELVVQGLQSKLPADFMLRAAFVAGAESSRSPKEIAAGAAAEAQFKGDELLGITVAAAIAGREPKAINELTRAVAKALASDGQGKDFFASQGLGADSTREQRLSAMAKAGVDTMEEIRSVVGITEDTGARALFNVLGNWDMFSAMKTRIEQGMEQPDVLRKVREKIETDSPFTLLDRLQRESQGAFDESTSTDTDAQFAMLKHKRIREAMIKRFGHSRNMFGFEMFNEDGSPKGMLRGLGVSAAQAEVASQVAEEMRELRRDMLEVKRRKPAVVQPEK
ncbi:MAG: hypothetical protein E6Q97_32825 [Desulfurellales bacterium]|nr:MAG: hypothetical protein E6Q97_32825 [Desulfurellales bacterium]